MGDLVRFTVHDKGSVVVEIDETDAAIRQIGRRDGKVRDLPVAFEEGLSSIRDAAATALEIFRSHLNPDEAKLSFGIKMTAEAGAIIARTAIEGNLGVELLWKRDGSSPGAGQPEEAS